MSVRDWALGKLREADAVVAADPVGDDFIHIERKKYRPFTTAAISCNHVATSSVDDLLDSGVQFEFIANIPRQAIWSGDAINQAVRHGLGWGGFGDLLRVIGKEVVAGYQNPEYSFVERGLRQHTRVSGLNRIFDRVFEIERRGLDNVTVVLLNEYEVVAEHIREIRDVYQEFDFVLKTNPNGRITSAAYEVARNIGVEIHAWGELLGRINKP
ncbi:MAG: hypothetical protein LDL39_08020 [Magnetospirillum sp.]|nr:hypothetical protein [Magnetospirillum sp.]